MKKLMVAVAIVCAAVFAQAGQIQWGSAWLNVAGQSGDEADVVDGATVYLFSGDSSTIFASLVSDFATTVAGSLNSATQGADYLASPTVGEVDGAYVLMDAASGSTPFFMVMKDGDNLYISETITANVPDVGTEGVEFMHDAAYAGTFYSNADSYQGAGWYNTAAIPEPTSGLLMLLGMAGLALRRRRA